MRKQEQSEDAKPRGRPRGTKFVAEPPVRLTREVLSALDEYAARASITRTAAMRRLIDEGLGIAGKPPRKPARRAAQPAQGEPKRRPGRPKSSQYVGNFPVGLTQRSLEALDALAARAEITRTEALRHLIEAGLLGPKSDRVNYFILNEPAVIGYRSDDDFKITGAQIRAARALLRWTADDLAERSKLGVATIRRAEAVDGPVPITVANADALVRTFEKAGVEFLNGDAPGVRVRNSPG
jgi:hypothetical protein